MGRIRSKVLRQGPNPWLPSFSVDYMNLFYSYVQTIGGVYCPDLIKGSNSIFGDIELDTPLESEFCALLDGTNRFNHRPTENFYFGKYLGFLPGNGLI